MIHIYCLIDPITGKIRYVGQSKDPVKRLKGHMSKNGSQLNPRKRMWLQGLKNRDLQPRLQILESVPDHMWKSAERRWIAKMKREGHPLLNKAPGGAYIPRRKRSKRRK